MIRIIELQIIIFLCLILSACAPETISPSGQVERANIGEQLPQSRDNVFLLDKRNLEEAPPSINDNIRRANSLVFNGREGDWKQAARELFSMINAIHNDESLPLAQRANDTQLISYMTFNALLKENANNESDGDYYAECLNLMLLTEPLDVGTMSNIYKYAKSAMSKDQREEFNMYLQRTIALAKNISSSLEKSEDANYRMLLFKSIAEAEQFFRLKK